MFLNSPVDIAIVFGVALLVFGPKKLPELGESLGKGLGNFKKALSNVQEDVSSAIKTDAPSSVEQQAAPLAAKASAPSSSSNSNSSSSSGPASGSSNENNSSTSS